MTAASSHERIHEIGKKIGSINRYLEVGVAKGDTFFNVNAREKHAVDPRFRFNPSVRRNHSMSSTILLQATNILQMLCRATLTST